jgi:serine/threonine protein kinase
VKVIDLGQACAIGTAKSRIQGTPDYIAPEQVKCAAVTPQTDIYNLGATLYWALTGTHIPTLYTSSAARTASSSTASWPRRRTSTRWCPSSSRTS